MPQKIITLTIVSVAGLFFVLVHIAPTMIAERPGLSMALGAILLVPALLVAWWSRRQRKVFRAFEAEPGD